MNNSRRFKLSLRMAVAGIIDVLMLTIVSSMSLTGCKCGTNNTNAVNEIIEQNLCEVLEQSAPDWGGCWILDLQSQDLVMGCEYEQQDSVYVSTGTKHLNMEADYGSLLYPLYALRIAEEGGIPLDTLNEICNMLINGRYNLQSIFSSVITPIAPARILSQYADLLSHQSDDKFVVPIKNALHRVVWDDELGSASINLWGIPRAQSEIVHIAGKTGAAQLPDGSGDSFYTNHRISFVGYFPEEDPRYICMAVLERPKWPSSAGETCGTLVRMIAERIYQTLN